MTTVTPLPAFSDNYLWLIRSGGLAAVVDPGDGQVVLDALRREGLQLAAVLVTHHHPDHVGGVELLRSQFEGVAVYGPRAEAGKIAGLGTLLDDGDTLHLPELGLRFQILAVPGHTLGHIAYHEPAAGLLFCGDTLFAAGCGRLFEGTPAQMFGSLQRLAGLPADTAVYCAHEYTLSNLDFARAVEPDNQPLAAEMQRVRELRAAGQPSVPSSVARERQFNPFLRCAVPNVGAAAERHTGRKLSSPVEVFAELRKWKDGYRPKL
ncbi:MAG: hydroxyacylglutathione hydrolase [Nevskia sp.]|nr:hydroxyacylglutathione hydrolase [Nevskia sp.]